VQDREYFKCEPGYGVFVQVENLELQSIHDKARGIMKSIFKNESVGIEEFVETLKKDWWIEDYLQRDNSLNIFKIS
jgi:hypothetical protein